MMRLLKRELLPFLLVSMIFLASCGGEKKPEDLLPSPTAELSYPVPGDQSAITYPGPLQTSQSESLTYPAPNSALILPEGQKPKAPATSPQPQAGKAAISGRLFSFTSRMLIPETNLYLMLALGENKELAPLLTGPKLEAGDIPLRSDANSDVIVDNIPPGAYYLVVWAPYSWSPVVNHADGTDSPRLFEFAADKSYVLGVLELAWP